MFIIEYSTVHNGFIRTRFLFLILINNNIHNIIGKMTIYMYYYYLLLKNLHYTII